MSTAAQMQLKSSSIIIIRCECEFVCLFVPHALMQKLLSGFLLIPYTSGYGIRYNLSIAMRSNVLINTVIIIPLFIHSKKFVSCISSI